MTNIHELNLNDLFSYNPETGVLYWNERPREHFKNHRAYAIWSSRYPGTAAGSRIEGYLYVRLDGKNYAVHKIAWYLQTGEWVEKPMEIDHINRVRDDNRWCNLRKLSKRQNAQNRAKHPRAIRRGVYWSETHQKWGVSGQKHYYGCLLNAVAKRMRMEREQGHILLEE